MDSNKDESEHCISIAQKYINEGDRAKALKFLYKAEKLYPSQRAKDLIELLEKLSDSTGDRNHYSRARSPDFKSNTNERSRSSSARRRTTRGSEVKFDYTEEQLEAVQKIKRCKDFYEILGVSKDAGESEIKKQYRKLALQFHPDKNKAPGATEAFKAIGNAFAVLNDPEKRKQYEAFGSSEKNNFRRSSCPRNASYYEYSRGFESEVSAEELFNMFFGGSFPGGMTPNTYPRRPQRRFTSSDSRNARGDANFSLIVQLIPILMVVLVSIFTSFFISDPPYSLNKSMKYSHERQTSNLGISYYVKENFATEFQGSIRRLEAQVEEEYISNLRGSCFKEKNYRESMIWKARNFRDRVLEEKAKALKTPSCDILNELYQNERGW